MVYEYVLWMVVGLTPTEQASTASAQDGMQQALSQAYPLQALPDTVDSTHPLYLCAM